MFAHSEQYINSRISISKSLEKMNQIQVNLSVLKFPKNYFNFEKIVESYNWS